MKFNLFILLIINLPLQIFGVYDRYTNRDIQSSLLHLRTNEIPFYASKYLYSSEYMKLNNYNNTSSIIFS